ncbi:MAG TPA: hypothetical protein VGI54_03320, partial [Solirubrobacteraceae bacterium]
MVSVRRATILALLALAAAPAAARAATVSLTLVPTGPDEDLTPHAVYTAGPGEANRLTATGTYVAGGPGTGLSFTVSDPGAVITAGKNCRALGAHAAACTAPPDAVSAGTIDAVLGDGDDQATGVSGADGGPGADRLSVLGGIDNYTPDPTTGGAGDDVITGPSTIDGGPGNDTLTTTPGARPSGYPAIDPDLVGGPGADVLVGPVTQGGPGDDTLTGTAGDDTLAGGPGDDVMDGGPGEDVVSYADAARGVHVDLRHPDGAGAPGEHDRLKGIEDVQGSPHADVLTGDAGPNVLDADQGGGADVVSGQGGRDTLWGGPSRTRGHVTLRGGSGDDTLEPSLRRDHVS